MGCGAWLRSQQLPGSWFCFAFCCGWLVGGVRHAKHLGWPGLRLYMCACLCSCDAVSSLQPSRGCVSLRQCVCTSVLLVLLWASNYRWLSGGQPGIASSVCCLLCTQPCSLVTYD